jgi:hypothetical protein
MKRFMLLPLAIFFLCFSSANFAADVFEWTAHNELILGALNDDNPQGVSAHLNSCIIDGVRLAAKQGKSECFTAWATTAILQQPDNNGLTPMHYFFIHMSEQTINAVNDLNSVPIVKVDVQIKDWDLGEVLHILAKLEDKGIDLAAVLTVVDNFGFTPIHYAHLNGFSKAFEGILGIKESLSHAKKDCGYYNSMKKRSSRKKTDSMMGSMREKVDSLGRFIGSSLSGKRKNSKRAPIPSFGMEG